MAKTKSGGSTRLGRDSQPKYLGVKRYDGQPANAGQILIRQRGTKFTAGKNVRRAGDDTLYAAKAGVVKFQTKKKIAFDGSRKIIKVINIETIKSAK